MSERQPGFDAEASIREARSRGYDIRRIMGQYNHAPASGAWKNFKCPFCESDSAGVYRSKSGPEKFKCFSTSCSTGTESLDEVGYLARVCNLDRKSAFQAYLKMAGVWKEVEKLCKPKKRGSREQGAGEKEEGRRKKEEVGDKAGAELGTEAKEMETGGVFEELSSGTCPGGPDGASGAGSSSGAMGADGTSESGRSSGAMEGCGASSAGDAKEEGERRKDEVGDEQAAALGTAAGGKEAGSREQGAGKSDGSDGSGAAVPSNVVALPLALPGLAEAGKAEADGKKEEGKAAAASAGKVGGPRRSIEENGLEAVSVFWSRCAWTPEDEEATWKKRGLTSWTQRALGFRSSPKSNAALLEALTSDYSIEALIKSGLWKWKRKEGPVPNAQFYGYGVSGKRPKAKDAETGDEEHGEHDWNDDKRWMFGWTHPPLVPYVERAAVVKVRPHKGSALGETWCGRVRLYVPRSVPELCVEAGQYRSDRPAEKERFEWVVITEGEFKAAALWQMVGEGARQFEGWEHEPLGVCALPGINFGKNPRLRCDLDAWLDRVEARRVTVVYDAEEHGDRERYPEAYREDWTKRHEAELWARYLAEDLRRKYGLKTEVGRLPEAWMNAKGKADWDGALAALAAKG